MSTILTLGSLRQAVGVNLGEGVVTGTFTTAPGSNAQDNTRYDPDGTWDNGFLMDTTLAGYPTARIQSWTQGNSTFTFFRQLAGTPLLNDAYEVHRALSFPELRECVNRGISLCGQSLRTLVRDESQSLVAGTYQYTPNYSASSANAFFPQGVVQVQIQYYIGLPTAPWRLLLDWAYLDDTVIQLSQTSVDAYAGNLIRFTGYGPVTSRLTTDDPAVVIGTFSNDFEVEMLGWAATYHGWLLLAAKKTSGEAKHEQEMAQYALTNFETARKLWSQPSLLKKMVTGTLPPGWNG